MKGIDNNAEALNIINSMLGSQENRIRSIYNLGYKQGYEDGLDEAVAKIKEKIFEDGDRE